MFRIRYVRYVFCHNVYSKNDFFFFLQVSLESDTYSAISCDSCRRCMRLPPIHPSHPFRASGRNPEASHHSSSSNHKAHPPDCESHRNYVTFLPAQTMYTNAANLQQTIWLQQQLFRQALHKGSNTTPSTPTAPSSALPPKVPPKESDQPVKMEWKVRLSFSRTRILLLILICTDAQIPIPVGEY